MYPVLDLGFMEIPLYSLIFAVAFVAMIFMARKLAERFEYPKSDIVNVCIYGGVGILIGAKIMYFISKLPMIITNFEWYLDYFERDFEGAINYSFGGMVFYGGLIGAVAGAYIYCRKHIMPFTPLMDIFAPLIPFVHGWGRVGCFMAGCCYGIEYHGFGCVQFPANELIAELDDVPRVPVQLLEAGFNFIIAIVLYMLIRRGKMKAGQLMGIYLVYYTVVRFAMEMLRGDAERGSVGGISTSQIISIVLIPIGIVLIHGGWLGKRMERRKRATDTESEE
ncbi:MAG: prolipoprotein diacylglyceryl transferase [Lachnospiraceae bacterium]|nr:prolipoprotein diacylglyceryl transferase [Lachnospiraceae bacterium]